jgi:hypothetical protein
MLMYNQNPFYSPPHSNFIKFLPHALKSGCNRAVLLIEGLFYTKSIIGKRIQVDGALQGEGLGLLDVLVAELVDPTGPAPLRAIGRYHRHAGEFQHGRRTESNGKGETCPVRAAVICVQLSSRHPPLTRTSKRRSLSCFL